MAEKYVRYILGIEDRSRGAGEGALSESLERAKLLFTNAGWLCADHSDIRGSQGQSMIPGKGKRPRECLLCPRQSVR